MIYTLTLAPAIDLYVETNDFNIGGINHPLSQRFLPGGKGINVSRMLKILGRDSVCLGFVGGYSGEYIKYYLDQIKVKNDFVLTDVHCRVNVKLTGAIKETAFNMVAPTYTKAELDKLYQKLIKLKKGDYLIMSGAVNTNISSIDYINKTLELLSKRGVILIADMTKTTLLRTLKYHPFLIKPNKEELEEMFFTRINSDKDVIKYAKKLIKNGAINVLVSLGADGAILVNKDNEYKVSAPTGKVINTVGSGDSMVAGFLDEYLRSNDLKKSLIKAVIAGSASAFSETLASLEEIKKLEKRFIVK